MMQWISWSFWSSCVGEGRQPYTDESDVLLVVAVLVQHVAQQHAQQVARFPVRVLVAWFEEER